MVNVYDSDVARANSCYSRPTEDGLVRVYEPGTPVPPDTDFVHRQLRALISCPEYVCAGARAAFHQGTYRFGLYDRMDSPSSCLGVARDLTHFVSEQPEMRGDYTTFIASFKSSLPKDENHFERMLWKHLQMLHNLDAPHNRCDSSVSDDPSDSRFEFSFGGRAFFVVGLNPVSSRMSRRFAYPTLVFNAHFQFEALRAKGVFERFQSVIRTKDVDLQGDYNPNLADFGNSSAARQYSGRAVEAEWRCPFRAMNA